MLMDVSKNPNNAVPVLEVFEIKEKVLGLRFNAVAAPMCSLTLKFFYRRPMAEDPCFTTSIAYSISVRFSNTDDKYSGQRFHLKKRFGLLPTQQSPLKY